MSSSLPNKVQELWQRIDAKEDFQKRIAEFRRENNIPEGGFGSIRAFVRWLENNERPKTEQFIRGIARDYGFLEYFAAVEELVEHRIYNMKDDKLNPMGVSPLGSELYQGEEFLDLLEGNEKYKKDLKKNVVIVLNKAANKQTLREFHADKDLWDLIDCMLADFNDEERPEPIRTRKQAENHLLIYEAYKKKILLSDGRLRKTYRLDGEHKPIP